MHEVLIVSKYLLTGQSCGIRTRITHTSELLPSDRQDRETSASYRYALGPRLQEAGWRTDAINTGSMTEY